MNAEQLLTHYGRIAEAQDAVVRLRQFILDLAIRGKLAPQDPDDEPASELLKQITAEKVRLAKAGEIRKPRTLPVAVEPPYALPKSWLWTRIRGVTSDRGQAAPDAPFSYIDVTAINKEVGVVANPTILDAKDAPSRARKITRKGDVIYSCVRPYLLNVAVIEEDFDPPPIASTAFAVLNGHGLVLSRYLWIVLRTQFMVERVEDVQRGQAYPAINDADFAVLPFPLPPLAEQERIVAKVNELMALCDRLDAGRAEREAARDRLAAASLARLITPIPETFADDASFTLGALPALTNRSNQIRLLRNAILNLAVCGKLVEQDPADEAAVELLARIQGSRKHKRKLAQINEREFKNPLPRLPEKWTWSSVDQLSDDEENAITDGPFGSQLKSDSYVTSPGYRVIRLQNIGNGVFRDDHQSYIDRARFDRLSKHHVQPGDLIVAGLVDPRVRCCEVPLGIGPALVKADCYRFSVHSQIQSRFVLHFLNSPLAEEFAAIHNHGMTLTRIGLGNFRRIPVPLPPPREQHRIVAKVDELMVLCDRLEAGLEAATTTRSRLLDALLAEALEPPPDAQRVAAE